MDNVSQIVALLRKQADLESQLMNGGGTPVTTERELEVTRRRLAAYPQALNAVLQTARAPSNTRHRVGPGGRGFRRIQLAILSRVMDHSNH